MNLLNGGISRISAVMLVCAMLCFTHFVQALPLASAPPFDHARTGFLLRDVHYTLKCEQCHIDGIFKNTPKVCSGCHATGTRVSALPKPLNHVPTNRECDTCHVSAATFLVKSYDHVGVTGNCSSCHNGQSLGVMGKSASHLLTVMPCENCHKNTSTFLSWTMNHTGLMGLCSTCHEQQYANVVSLPPVPVVHIPLQSGQECDVCHTPSNTSNFMTFLGVTTYDHSGITGTCASCHSGSMNGVVKLPPVPANHVTPQVGQDCNACHASTSTFLGALYPHIGVTPGTCETCHTGAYPGVLTKPATHIPVAAMKCDVCHTAINTVGYTSFKGSEYHIAVTPAAGSCTGCHNGSYGLASGNGLVPQSVANAAGGHIQVAGSSCDLCHTATNTILYTTFQGATYHASQSAAAGSCATCHTGTITTNSASGVYPYGKTSIPAIVHVTTTASCETCHTQATTANYTTFLGAVYTHPSGVAGTCSTCHNNTNAKGKSLTHISTALQCDSAGCHTSVTTANYTTFLNGTVHPATGAPTVTATTCGNANCHGAPLATNALGIPAVHPYPSVSAVPVTSCGSSSGCHTTTTYVTWSGTMYHPGGLATAGGCGNAGCHDGTTLGYGAQGTVSYATHQTVSGPACDSCHSNTANYTTWLGAAFVHAPAQNGICQTCHNGTTALGLPANHIPAAGQSCDLCHTGLNPNVANNPAYAGLATAWIGATYTHAASVAGTCSTCHSGTYPGVSSKTSNPGGLAGLNGLPHVVTAAQCDTCHTLTISMYTSANPTWAGAGFDHTTAAAGSCVNAGCHGAGGTGKGVSTNHIPVSISCDSGGCHKVFGAGATTFAGGIWNHSVAPFSTQRCDSCHGIYTAFGTYGAVGKVPTHIPSTLTGSLDCTTCHTSTLVPPPTGAASAGAAAWVNVVTNHNGDTTSTDCVICHESKGYLSSKMKVKSGHNATKVCNSCHKSCYYTNWNAN